MLLCYQFCTLTCIHVVFQCLHLTKWRVLANERRELFHLWYGQKNAKSALIYGHIFFKTISCKYITVFVSVCHTMSLSVLVSKRFHTVSESSHNNQLRLSVGSYLYQSSRDQPHVSDIFTMMPHSSQDKFPSLIIHFMHIVISPSQHHKIKAMIYQQ